MSDDDEPRLEEEDFGGAVRDLQPVRPPTVEWSRERGRELVRALVAGALILLLTVLTAAALIAVIAGVASREIRSIMEIVLPPVVALCGSAIGFYFGSDQSQLK